MSSMRSRIQESGWPHATYALGELYVDQARIDLVSDQPQHHNEIESIACVGCNHEFDDVASLCEHVKTTRCEAIKAKYLRKQLERSKRASGSAATSNQS